MVGRAVSYPIRLRSRTFAPLLLLCRRIVVVLGFLLLPEIAPAADMASLVRRADEYGKEVSRIEASGRTASLEGLLRRGDDLAAEMKTVIEHLSVEDYGSVERGMRGFVVNREEVILVEPDTRFFSKLAREIGTPQDRANFRFTQS